MRDEDKMKNLAYFYHLELLDTPEVSCTVTWLFTQEDSTQPRQGLQKHQGVTGASSTFSLILSRHPPLRLFGPTDMVQY